jgi:hypothetical protein
MAVGYQIIFSFSDFLVSLEFFFAGIVILKGLRAIMGAKAVQARKLSAKSPDSNT